MSRSNVVVNKTRRHVENYSAFAKSYELEKANKGIPVNPNPDQPTVYRVTVREPYEGIVEEKFFLSYEKANTCLAELKKEWGEEYFLFNLHVLKFED